MADLKAEAIRRGLLASIGETTIWQWLSEDAIRPWRHRSWIFPRDPQFAEKAGRILDLYESIWEGRPLGDADCVLSTDEKTSIQARRRKHPSLPPASRRSMGSGKMGTLLNYWNNSPSFLFLTNQNGEADAFPSASAHSQAQTRRFVLKMRPSGCNKQFLQRYPGLFLRFVLPL